MSEPLPKPILSHLNYIGWYQIVGGCIGVIMTARSLIFDEIEWNYLLIIIYSLFLLFFGYSIFSGVLCVGKKDTALTHTFVNQALQAIHFNLFGYGLTYASGFYFTLVFDLANPGVPAFRLGIFAINIQFNGSTLNPELGFNIVALFFLYWAWQLRKRIAREKQINLI